MKYEFAQLAAHGGLFGFTSQKTQKCARFRPSWSAIYPELCNFDATL